jgi:hypothetical protein
MLEISSFFHPFLRQEIHYRIVVLLAFQSQHSFLPEIVYNSIHEEFPFIAQFLCSSQVYYEPIPT